MILISHETDLTLLTSQEMIFSFNSKQLISFSRHFDIDIFITSRLLQFSICRNEVGVKEFNQHWLQIVQFVQLVQKVPARLRYSFCFFIVFLLVLIKGL